MHIILQLYCTLLYSLFQFPDASFMFPDLIYLEGIYRNQAKGGFSKAGIFHLLKYLLGIHTDKSKLNSSSLISKILIKTTELNFCLKKLFNRVHNEKCQSLGPYTLYIRLTKLCIPKTTNFYSNIVIIECWDLLTQILFKTFYFFTPLLYFWR